MRPFQQLRLWARRAPLIERGTALAIATIVLASMTWLAVPPADDDTAITDVAADRTAAAPPEAAAGATGAEAIGDVPATGPAGAPTVGGTAGPVSRSADASRPAASGGGPAAATGGCVSPPGSDQGVTDKEIKIALTLVELAGDAGNETVNVPPAPQQKADYDAIVDEINKTGGVACRQLKVLYFTINPLDQAQLRQTCLDVAQAGVFYVNDLGGYAAFPAIVDCYAENKLPFYEGNFLPESQIDAGYPYLFVAATQDNLFFNTVFALRDRGFFDPAQGFRKLGYFYRECIPEHPRKVLSWLQQAGVPSSQIVTYNFGCPVGIYVSPSDIAQAALRFQQNGVTHVLTHGASDWFQFSRVAQQQGYKPKYGVSDQSTSFSSYGTNGPEWNNIDGSVLISNYRFNEERTPGNVPTDATERCARIMRARGQPHPYNQKIGMSGVACNQLWFFANAANHAPELKRTALAAGLNRGGPIDFAYPYGPSTFPTPKTTYHGNFWRPQVAYASCNCWRVADFMFQPTFPGFR